MSVTDVTASLPALVSLCMYVCSCSADILRRKKGAFKLIALDFRSFLLSDRSKVKIFHTKRCGSSNCFD